MSSEHRDGRREPGGRAPHRAHRTAAVRGVGGRIADPVAFDPSGHLRACAVRRQRQHVAHFHQHARARASSRRSRTRRCLRIRDAQPAAIRGTALEVAVLEANNAPRIGRFGWKSQHASLESFAADAYLNEMGITTPVLPDENTSLGRYVGFGTPYDPVPDPEDDGVDVVAFANFMRATKAPPRGADQRDRCARARRCSTPSGCGGCHIADDSHRGAGHAHQRRGTASARCGGEQDHPSLQRLPAARHRHGRWHSGVAGRGVRIDRDADPHGAAVGAAHAQSADARRTVVHQAGGHRAACRTGRRLRERPTTRSRRRRRTRCWLSSTRYELRNKRERCWWAAGQGRTRGPPFHRRCRCVRTG